MNRLYEQFLENRGYDNDTLNKINSDYYENLQDIEKMGETLEKIYKNQDEITVLPDFDMDGIASAVLGFSALAELGFKVNLYKRDSKLGYEFSRKDIDFLLKDYPNTKVIITCDVGISCYGAIKYAKDLGLLVLVTDHHLENEKTKKKMCADIVVNPNKVGETYTNKSICGAFVLWQVLYYYAKEYRGKFLQDQIYRLRVFAGIGTVSDNMALLYENRSLVKDTISILKMLDKGSEEDLDYSFLNFEKTDEDDEKEDEEKFNDRLLYDNLYESLIESIKKTSNSPIYIRVFDGLSSLLDVLRANDKFRDIDEGLIGFYIAPMFNSIKRLGEDMLMALSVFFAPSHNQRLSAAYNLFELNERRKEEVKYYLEEIFKIDQPFAPYIYKSNAGSGIYGLLAMNIVNKTSLPTLVIGKKPTGYGYNGSGRSESWYNFLTVLRENGYFAQGHENAFGVGFTDKKEVKSCFRFLEKNVEDVIKNLDSESLEKSYDLYLSDIDIEGFNIDLDEIRVFINLYKELKPFGVGFREPIVKVSFDMNDAKAFKIGSEGQHLKIILDNGLGVLKWNDVEKFDDILNSQKIEVIGKLEVSEFMGNISVNLIGDSIKCLD